VKKAKLNTLVNGYRQVILICGALHLQNLETLLKAAGYRVQVSVNSLQDAFKEPMAVVKNPDYVVRLVQDGIREAPDLPVIDADLVVENLPSAQVADEVDSLLNTVLPESTSAQRQAIMTDFSASYARESLRSRTAWTVFLPLDDGTTVRITRGDASGDLSAIHYKPLAITDLRDLPTAKSGTPAPIVDIDELKWLSRMDKGGMGYKVITVERHAEGQQERYYAKDDNGPLFTKDHNVCCKSARELIETLEPGFEQTGTREIYLDLVNFPEVKSDAFATALTIAGEQQTHKDVRENKRTSSEIAGPIFIGTLNRAAGEKIQSHQLVLTRPASITSVSKDLMKRDEGRFAGAFHFLATIRFKVGGVVNELSVFFIGASHEIAQWFMGYVTQRFLGQEATGDLREQSIADLMKEARREIIRAGFAPGDIAVEVVDPETGESDYVEMRLLERANAA
jgi:hypothetical protein